MNETGEQQLPPGWVRAYLGDVINVIRGVTYRKEESRKDSSAGFVPVLRATNIQGALNFDDLVYVPEKDVSECQILRPGDIVVAASSGSLSVVGKAAQLKNEWHGSFGAFCFCLRPEPAFESRFLGWFLHTTEYRNRVSKASAGVNINNLRAEHIERTPFRIPPAAEQTRIADALDELFSDLDAGVAALERAQAKLKHYRAAVLKAAVEGALTAEWRTQHPAVEPASALLARILAERRRRWEEAQLQKFKDAGKSPPKDWKAKYKEPVAPDTTNLPPLPEGWCWATFDQVSDVEGGLQKTPDRAPKRHHFPFLRVANVLRGTLDLRELHRFELTNAELDRLRLQRGDLLIVEGNGSRTEIGRSALWSGEVADCVHQNHIIRARPFADIDPKFMALFMNSPVGQLAIQLVASSTSGLYTLSVGKIQRLPITIPPASEQVAIVEAVEDQLSVIDHLEADLEAKLKSAQALRQSILRHAFTGRLVPQGPKDEPAAALLKRIAADRAERVRLSRGLNGRRRKGKLIP